MQIAVIAVEYVRIPDGAKEVAVRPNRDDVEGEQHVVELWNRRDDAQNPGIDGQNRDGERSFCQYPGCLRRTHRRRHVILPNRTADVAPAVLPMRTPAPPAVRTPALPPARPAYLPRPALPQRCLCRAAIQIGRA